MKIQTIRNRFKKSIPFFIFFIVILLLPMFFSMFGFKYLITYKLKKELNLQEVIIKKAYFSWLGPQQFNEIMLKKDDESICNITYFSFNCPIWSFFSKKNFKNFLSYNPSIKGLKGSFNKNFLIIDQLNVVMNGNNKKIILNGSVIESSNIGTFEGNMFFNKDSFNINFNLKNVYVKVIDDLVNLIQNKQINLFYRFFGKKISDVNIHLYQNEKTNFINAYFLSNIFNLDLSGMVLNNEIRLNKPLSISFNVLNEFFSRDMPYVIDSIFPAKIWINNKDFACPLFPIKLKNIAIKESTMDLGKIKLVIKQDNDNIHDLLKFLKIHNDKILLWFGKMKFQLSHGLFDFGRVDYLIDDKIHLCSWGNVNLINKDIDMKLGVTSQAFKEIFKLSLPANYILPIQVHGNIDDVRIDKDKVMNELTHIITREYVEDIIPIFGKMIDLMIPTDKVPKPNKPFPWE